VHCVYAGAGDAPDCCALQRREGVGCSAIFSAMPVKVCQKYQASNYFMKSRYFAAAPQHVSSAELHHIGAQKHCPLRRF
jgi:hypothetical protein